MLGTCAEDDKLSKLILSLWCLLNVGVPQSGTGAETYLRTLQNNVLIRPCSQSVALDHCLDTRPSGHANSEPEIRRAANVIPGIPLQIIRRSQQIYCDKGLQCYDGKTARRTRRSDEALEVRVSVALTAPSLLDLDAQLYPTITGSVYLEIFQAREAQKHGRDKGDTAMRIRCTIATKRKARLNFQEVRIILAHFIGNLYSIFELFPLVHSVSEHCSDGYVMRGGVRNERVLERVSTHHHEHRVKRSRCVDPSHTWPETALKSRDKEKKKKTESERNDKDILIGRPSRSKSPYSVIGVILDGGSRLERTRNMISALELRGKRPIWRRVNTACGGIILTTRTDLRDIWVNQHVRDALRRQTNCFTSVSACHSSGLTSCSTGKIDVNAANCDKTTFGACHIAARPTYITARGDHTPYREDVTGLMGVCECDQLTTRTTFVEFPCSSRNAVTFRKSVRWDEHPVTYERTFGWKTVNSALHWLAAGQYGKAGVVLTSIMASVTIGSNRTLCPAAVWTSDRQAALTRAATQALRGWLATAGRADLPGLDVRGGIYRRWSGARHPPARGGSHWIRRTSHSLPASLLPAAALYSLPQSSLLSQIRGESARRRVNDEVHSVLSGTLSGSHVVFKSNCAKRIETCKISGSNGKSGRCTVNVSNVADLRIKRRWPLCFDLKQVRSVDALKRTLEKYGFETRVGRKAAQCRGTEIGCAQPARSVYLILNLWSQKQITRPIECCSGEVNGMERELDGSQQHGLESGSGVKGDTHQKVRQPAASSATIPTCENSGVNPAGTRTRFALVRQK
ncbi:hypothetical protein PR048_003560 [Dryococelus australis]|uniref:Uncharacterized protein n=1 Tax=Dryococelus australis TaxID=614101 RepID=A0ABQ9INF8_9NEOP|nr:hypothetical protein PR048_003560 [Dryococelus australis]